MLFDHAKMECVSNSMIFATPFRFHLLGGGLDTRRTTRELEISDQRTRREDRGARG